MYKKTNINYTLIILFNLGPYRYQISRRISQIYINTNIVEKFNYYLYNKINKIMHAKV